MTPDLWRIVALMGLVIINLIVIRRIWLVALRDDPDPRDNEADSRAETVEAPSP